MLPDGAAGVFAPGWDVSFDQTAPKPGASGSEAEGIVFLNNYGLGSPFPEDAMLCAALSSFWPAVAPDITRTFAPTGRYHSATPLTDETIGLGKSAPWDGIKGPVPGPDADTLDYRRLEYGDYVEAAIDGRFDLSSIANTTPAEYIARTLTMAMVYHALGVTERFEKSKWAVLSFRRADPADPDLVPDERRAGPSSRSPTHLSFRDDPPRQPDVAASEVLRSRSCKGCRASAAFRRPDSRPAQLDFRHEGSALCQNQLISSSSAAGLRAPRPGLQRFSMARE